uniref:Fc gamma binding protein n=1 Tax=Takifugu rubripes TaxID=31033 RepID=H2RJX0_TAKRU
MGDPHYHTFDGRRFDFMGTCTYVIAKNCMADDKLQSFEVLAENENRGSLRVSYVGVVTVKVYSITITVVRSERGRVRIDNSLWTLPIALNNNKLLLSQSGRSVLIQTDFGLTVRYDWNNRLLVSLTDSYAGKTCGLCGNFNGNPNDDFTTPSGTQANGAVAFGSSWKVQGMGEKAHCRDDCVGGCDHCENKNMKHWESDTFCGIITLKNGPFSKCHSTIDPQVYLENCKYDVCMAKGSRHFLCNALEDYTEVCQTAGVQVQDWRKMSKCHVTCPANSHYELCGSACPATCSDPNAPSKCKLPCVQTCTCNEGFVLSGNRCVRTNNCGCTHEGRYVPSGESFWADDSCRRWCKCNPRNRKVECKDKSCKAGEQCKVIKGVRKCHALSQSTCHSSGDPHYMTFDREKFDFQGTCVYQLAALCNNNTELEQFEVRVQNEHRHNKRVSFTKLVEVKVYSLSIIMTTSYKGNILVNNELVNLPVTLDEGRISVQKNGLIAVVTTTFGLKVTFDWRSRASVTLPGTYEGAVCGLCGNYNGKKADDLIPKNGDKPVPASEFGNSWKIGEIPGCVGGCKGVCPKCDINQKIQYEQKDFCGIIKDPSGPFRECHAKVSPAEYFEDCVFDVCMYKGRKEELCQAVTSYTEACQNEGAKVFNWRTSQFCAMKCPLHSHYELCANGCPASCMSLVSPVACDSDCKEACSCDDEYILSGDVCVPLSQCGCLYDNKYYRTGQVFYPNGKCQEQCKCKQGGEVECKDFKCGPNEECKIVKGIHKCHPVGKGVCQASGDPHYTSFDGLKFDFQGTCTYTLSKSCGLEGSNLVDFSVNVENVQWEQNKKVVVSVTKMVAVEVYGFTLIMKQKTSGILVNGVLRHLPLNLNEGAVKIYKRGRRYIVETDFELIVTYDLVYHVTVTVPGNYRDKVCGLCGNFNGNKGDDFRDSRGIIVKDVNSFGASWKVKIPGAVCLDGCKGKSCPTCKAPLKALFSTSTYCGIMTAPNGPFKICHDKLDPKPYFDDCIFDVCASNGEGSALCDSVATYAFSCHKAGVDIKNWRTKSFCPMKCPTNSHYEVCADNWALTCPGLTDIVFPTPECTEGCECNDAFSFNGETCIEENKCGCFDNGKSYKPGEVMYEENCEEKCTCQPDKGLVCEQHSCPQNTKCIVRKGVRACYHTDPCEDVKCRIKEKCRVVKGEAECVPVYTGTCWAWGDPHFHTYDGYNFDFQGTCNYVMSETCGDLDGLVPFSVTERNDNRGNKAVSYVREVHVSVYGYSITIRKNQVGRVMVDGQLLNLPVELGEGKVSLLHRGGRAVVETNFGLVVSYEWRWHLVIKLPSSYYGSVCGLCGNFNGNRADERLDPAGKAVPSVIEWGKSWQTPDQDKDSPCYVCEKDCPTCNENMLQRYQTEAFCGALTAKKGLFKICHKKVDPQAFFHSCVYDICLNDGDKKMLCQALTSYTSECNDKGVKITGWRKKYGCPMNCPRHSHYEECASPCQPSCPFPDEPVTCTLNCVESCVCDKGYVLSGGVCVPQETCGCSYEGRYYKPGQRFWADEGCSRLCECDTTLGLVKCSEASCSAKEVCTLVDGQRTCAATSHATCSASGDPHYHTFDGHRFDFQGTCVYQLVGLCSRQEGLEPFNVTVQNDHRGSTSVSFTKTVKLYIYGITLTLSRQYPNRILLNDELALLPLEDSDKLKVSLSGRKAVVNTAAGITVTFDWQSTVRVTLPSTYQSMVCGLCGNYNGKGQDDMSMPNGQTTTNSNKLGESWQVALTPGCSTACQGAHCQECSEEQKSKYEAQRYCGIITEKTGSFKNCHKQLDPGPFLKDCVFDACQYHGHFAAICDAIQIYASACQNEGITVDTWRREDFCPMTCPANSHYTLCASACPTTCSSLTSDKKCHKACIEGCECNDGYLLSGDTCVPVKDCGCSYEGRYYRKGDIIYPDSQCEEKCVCGETGDMSCQKTKCLKGETCKLLNGVNGCHPIKHDKCVASGDPHYISFDGRRFDFQGTCEYVLAKTCDIDPNSLTAFTVTQRNQRFGNGRVAVTKTITVQVFGYEITIKQGVPWKVNVITQQGQNIIVQTDFGLKVLYNTVYYVEVIVPSTYQGKMCGLCGNNNNNPRDDFKLPSGQNTRDVDQFGKSWALDQHTDECGGCGKQCPVCPKAKETLFSKPDSCGIISDPKGPFKACHTEINPEPYLSDCVFDACATGGNKDTQCNNIMAYALACQGAGVQIEPWRTTSSCPASCPSNSHYELSGSTCGGTCASFIGQFACSERRFEGCQCDPGFVFDANKCVPLENCGCVFNGRYLRVGESVICSKCSSACTCKASGMTSCQEVSCASGEECSIRDGTRGCFIRQKKCSISRKGHITSFDAMSGAIANNGAFELASLCDESNQQWFRVVVDIRVCSTGSSPTVAILYVFFKDTTVAVNSQHVTWVRSAGNTVVTDITPAVRVTYSRAQEVTVIVDGTLTNKLCGACGNGNDDPKDDMQTANGKVTNNVAEIVASWRAGDFSRWWVI